MRSIKMLLLALTVFPFLSAAQPCSVTFFVQDTDNKPMEGVVIRIEELRYTPQSTGNDGKTVFAKAPKGKIHYQVVKPGYITLDGESDNVICDDKADVFKVTLRKLPPPTIIIIFGKIRSLKQASAQGIKVGVNVAGKKWSAQTDETGNYVIEIPEKEIREQTFTIEALPLACPPVSLTQEVPKDNVVKIDMDVCDTDRGLSVVREEIMANFSTLSALIGSIELSVPSDVMMRKPGETEKEFQARAKIFRFSERDLVKQAFDKFQIHSETFSAHQLGIKDEKLMANIRNVYLRQKESVDAAYGYVEQLNHLLSLEKPDDVFRREARCKQEEKVLDAKINLADAAGLYAWTLEDSTDIEILNLFLRLASLRFKSTKQKDFYQESRLTIAGLYSQKAQSIGKCAGLKPPPPNTDTALSNADLLKMIDTIFAPTPTRPFRVKIDSALRDPEKLLSEGTMAYLSGDSHATRYYYQVGLQNDTVGEHFKRYFALSIERLDKPEIYGGGLGMMVLKITPKNGFDKAGIRKFDVVTAINGKTVKEPKEISDELIGQGKSDSLIEYWRDGKKKTAVVKAGRQAGALVVPLVICEPLQL